MGIVVAYELDREERGKIEGLFEKYRLTPPSAMLIEMYALIGEVILETCREICKARDGK